MRAVIYYRKSTKDKQDFGMQIHSVENYCKINSIEPIKTYRDEISGSKDSRPEFDLMLRDLRNGVFDTIIVYKLDRIGRSTSHLLKLFEEFEKKGIKFIAVTQNINTDSPEGKLMLRMLMILAEYERDLTISRINDGLERAREKGSKLGRPKGQKDTKRRRRSGYYQRWSKKTTPSKIPPSYTEK